MGFGDGGSMPRSIVIERQTSLAIGTICVVFASTLQASLITTDHRDRLLLLLMTGGIGVDAVALAAVTVTKTPAEEITELVTSSK